MTALTCEWDVGNWKTDYLDCGKPATHYASDDAAGAEKLPVCAGHAQDAQAAECVVEPIGGAQ
jgi:hypothetical protein